MLKVTGAVLGIIVSCILIFGFIGGIMFILMKDKMYKFFVDDEQFGQHKELMTERFKHLNTGMDTIAQSFSNFKKEVKTDMDIIKSYMLKGGK